MTEIKSGPPADEKELADYIAWASRELGCPVDEVVVYGMGGHPVACSRRSRPPDRGPTP